LLSNFTRRVIKIIQNIPCGKVATYGQIARLAGNNRGARQVAWILHSSSGKENLPWYRVVNCAGRISLPRGAGYEHQKMLLLEEGITFSKDEVIGLKRFQWKPNNFKN